MRISWYSVLVSSYGVARSVSGAGPGAARGLRRQCAGRPRVCSAEHAQLVLDKRGCRVPLLVPARAKPCFVDGEDGRMCAGAVQELVLCGRAPGHGQEARLFAKPLGHFLEPSSARPPSVGAAGSLGCAWVIKASPRAASQALPAEHLHISCGRPSGPPRSTASGPVYL